MVSKTAISILCPCNNKYHITTYSGILLSQSTVPITLHHGLPLNSDVNGVLVCCSSTDNATSFITPLKTAVENYIPVLAVSYGMALLNFAMGGNNVLTKYTDNLSQAFRRVFFSIGGKLSHIIGGSGWVRVAVENCGIPIEDVATGMMTSCYAEDLSAYGIERAGNHWVIGIGWHVYGQLPRGLDNPIYALIERAVLNKTK